MQAALQADLPENGEGKEDQERKARHKAVPRQYTATQRNTVEHVKRHPDWAAQQHRKA